MLTIKYKSSIVIRRPVDEVFDFVAAGFFENRPTWSPYVQDAQKLSDGPVGVGTKGIESGYDIADRAITTNYIVTDYVLNREFGLEGVTTFRNANDDTNVKKTGEEGASTKFSTRYLFESTREGTRTTTFFEGEFKISGFYRVMLPHWKSYLAERSRISARNLKNVIEMKAGLEPAKEPTHIPRAWIALSVCIMLILILWSTYALRDTLQISHGWLLIMQVALGSILAVVVTWLYLVGAIFRP
ncbi:MAG TPA: SRPBCC family protein [Chloroflexia bacterium]|nr:SRPBCC family protein [Chloroflexia bacterium]